MYTLICISLFNTDTHIRMHKSSPKCVYLPNIFQHGCTHRDVHCYKSPHTYSQLYITFKHRHIYRGMYTHKSPHTYGQLYLTFLDTHIQRDVHRYKSPHLYKSPHTYSLLYIVFNHRHTHIYIEECTMLLLCNIHCQLSPLNIDTHAYTYIACIHMYRLACRTIYIYGGMYVNCYIVFVVIPKMENDTHVCAYTSTNAYGTHRLDGLSSSRV